VEMERRVTFTFAHIAQITSRRSSQATSNVLTAQTKVKHVLPIMTSLKPADRIT
jgi:hypothetical protein